MQPSCQALRDTALDTVAILSAQHGQQSRGTCKRGRLRLAPLTCAEGGRFQAGAPLAQALLKGPAAATILPYPFPGTSSRGRGHTLTRG